MDIRGRRLRVTAAADEALNRKYAADLALRLAKVHNELTDIAGDRSLVDHPATKDALKAVDKAVVQVSKALAGVYAALGE